MRKLAGGFVLAALGLCLLESGSAWADRTPGTRSQGQRNHGVRSDTSVPYLTNGTNAFNARNVAPKVTSSPIVEDTQHPQAKPVYNLPFYGAVQSFGDKSNGATPGPGRTLRKR